jgi:hypothetical protein
MPHLLIVGCGLRLPVLTAVDESEIVGNWARRREFKSRVVSEDDFEFHPDGSYIRRIVDKGGPMVTRQGTWQLRAGCVVFDQTLQARVGMRVTSRLLLVLPTEMNVVETDDDALDRVP